MLCIGPLWTSNVRALSLSDRVPEWMILERKLASDVWVEEETWNASISRSCSDAARAVNWLSSAPEAREDEGIGASSQVYHCGNGCKVKVVLELSDIFFGISTLGAGVGSGGVSSGLDSFCFLDFVSFLDFLSCFLAALDDYKDERLLAVSHRFYALGEHPKA